MTKLTRKLSWPGGADSADVLLTREWLVTNGLGGYASGTVAGVTTRRFHGYLIASLPAPLGRMMMLNDLVESLIFPDGKKVQLGGEERANAPIQLYGANYLIGFELDAGLPVWRYKIDNIVLEKRLVLPHNQNTVYISYRIVDGDGGLKLNLRPSINIRPHESAVDVPISTFPSLNVFEDQYEVFAGAGIPPLRLLLYGMGAALTIDRHRIQEVAYRIEQSRGYDSRGDLWSPGFFHADMVRDRDATLVASTEAWETIRALTPNDAFSSERGRRARLLARAKPEVQEGPAAELVLAADQFVFRPVGRLEDSAQAQAMGDEIRGIIAGYHWFTDWGRDTMISLEGLTLVTGRPIEASYILRSFSRYIRDGLIPNMFPEGQKEAVYHTADATLWLFQTLQRYLRHTGDRALLGMMLPKLLDVIDHHVRGTRFGIHVDPKDGLLVEGAPGYQLTWMDAKVDDWVVTPRRGKAVEINALWYNALRLLEEWLRDDAGGEDASRLRELADRARHSFNERFWNPDRGCLFDVIDGEQGNDPACRPNQLLAISLDHPILDPARWKAVVAICEEKLLTPVGLRSLSPGDKDYKARYDGDLRARDAAYHQGTVWSWLIGPFVDAWIKVHPTEAAGARKFLDGLVAHLSEAGMGTISEIFDAEPPFTPRGCIAQAWGVAEVLRCWMKTDPGGMQTEGATTSHP